MKLAAVEAIASLVSDEELHEDFVVPKALDERVAGVVAMAVGSAAIESGVSVLFQQPEIAPDVLAAEKALEQAEQIVTVDGDSEGKVAIG